MSMVNNESKKHTYQIKEEVFYKQTAKFKGRTQ